MGNNNSPQSLLSWRRSRRVTVAMAAMATTAVLLFHFSMTALYNTPFNPVQKDLSRVITGYMSPQFSQDWHLFAPDPVDADSGILVRAKVRTQDGQDVTGWTDITTPHIAKVHSQRMWPARVDRLPTGVKAQLESWRDPLLEKIRNKNKLDQPKGSAKGGTKAENPPLTVSEKSGRENATRFAQALATSEARRHWGDAVQGIQIRVVSNEYPRFSERHIREVKGKISYYDLDWMKPLKVSG